MASAFLFERKTFSTSASTLKAACRTVGERAFHAPILPAR